MEVEWLWSYCSTYFEPDVLKYSLGPLANWNILRDASFRCHQATTADSEAVGGRIVAGPFLSKDGWEFPMDER